MKQYTPAGIRKKPHTSCAVWVCGSILLAAALLTRARAGSPLPVLHLLGADTHLPSLSLLGLCWLGGFFLLGCGAGCVFSRRVSGTPAAWRLRGTVYGLLCVPVALGWYPLLFAAQALWLSWMCLLLSGFLCILCTLCWARVLRRSLLFLIPASSWMIYLAVLQFIVLIRR